MSDLPLPPHVPDLLELIPVIVACHTPECGNGEISIEVMLAGADGIVFCGVCSQQITDITVIEQPEGVPDAPPVA